MSGSYDIRGFPLEIRSTSRSFGEWIDGALADYRVPETPRPFYSVLVRSEEESQRGRYHILYRGSVPVVRTLSQTVLARTLLDDLEALLYWEREDAVYLDATVLSLGGLTWLIPTSMSVYLSRLGRRLARNGGSITVSKGMAVSLVDGRALPIEPRINAREVPLPWSGETDEKRGGSPLRLQTPVSIDAVCAQSVDDGGLRPMSRGETLYQLFPAVMNADEVGSEGLRGLGRLIERASCYRWGVLNPVHRLLDAMLEVTKVPATVG